jgi:hypothetical protein
MFVGGSLLAEQELPEERDKQEDDGAIALVKELLPFVAVVVVVVVVLLFAVVGDADKDGFIELEEEAVLSQLCWSSEVKSERRETDLSVGFVPPMSPITLGSDDVVWSGGVTKWEDVEEVATDSNGVDLSRDLECFDEDEDGDVKATDGQGQLGVEILSKEGKPAAMD